MKRAVISRFLRTLVAVLAGCAPTDDHDVASSTAALGPPPGYYDSVDTSTPATLRATLHAVIDDHTRFPYTATATDTWDILEQADQDPLDPGRILDIYKNASYPKFGAGNSFYNREHTWPNSYGFSIDGSGNYPFSDANMLMLSDSSYNSSRSNLPFQTCAAGCQEKPTDANNGKGGGTGVYPGNSNWRTGAGNTGSWETWNGRRGDVARAQLYADVRYEGGLHGVTGAAEPELILTDDRALIVVTGGNAAVAYMGIRSTILQWHAEDPPDAVENRRNDVVFSFQGNRNPFIDHPEWADCLFNGVCGPPPPPPPGCTQHSDCNDSNACTVDTCSVSVCNHAPAACGSADACCIAGCGDPDCAAGPDHVLIAQVGYDTPGDEALQEFVDLYNPTAQPVALGGWTLTDNFSTWAFPAGTTVASRAWLSVARNAAGFRALYGKDPDVAGMTLALANGGDRVVLASGAEVDRVAWANFDPGWTITAPAGSSIERADLAVDTNTVSDWKVTTPAMPRGGPQSCLANADCADANPCTQDLCSAGACSHPAVAAGTVCRAAAGGCDLAETCEGTTCPVDGLAAAGATCRPAAGACDPAETCNGSSAACPADAKAALGTTCRPAAGACDIVESCDGTGDACPADAFVTASTICRASASSCDVGEACSGASAACPADSFVAAGTECRASAGVCDTAEACAGSAACPSDTFASGNVCRPAASACDAAETCDGTGVSCPTDLWSPAETVCRPAAGGCDAPEICTGLSDQCPAEAVEPAGTVCRPAASACDVAEACNGAGTDCPGDAVNTAPGVVCRTSAGACDAAEECTRTSGTCPADGYQSAGTACRASAGPCDASETCSGAGASCPADGKVAAGAECGPSAGACDPAEACDGVNDACPANLWTASGTLCRAGAGPCDEAEACTGTSADCPAEGFAAEGSVCRAAAGPCDAAEACSGAGPSCPPDAGQPNGTACSDGNLCSTGDQCLGGSCSGTAVDCAPLSNSCRAGYCDSATGACAWTAINEGGACDDASAQTVNDRCSAGTCAGTLSDPVLLSVAADNTTLPGLGAVNNEDIVQFDRASGQYSLWFDGSAAGLPTSTGLSGFHVLADGSLLLSFTSNVTLPGVGQTADRFDIVRRTTGGAWQMHFDGSDVALSSSPDERLDAISALPDGRILISVQGNFSAGGVTAADEDLLAFTPTSLGAATTGSWALYFDGSDVGLTLADEDIDAFDVMDDGSILLSITGSGNGSVAGVASFSASDVLRFAPTSLGSNTAGTYTLWQTGLSGSVTGLHYPR